VERHASESYHVLGEGLLAVTAGGRRDCPGMAADATDAAPPFRFSRIGPEGRQLDDLTIRRLSAAMTHGGGFGAEQSDVPAGFTYLGQFIAHDMSFDRTCVTLGENVSPARLLQGRSPCLDLDSLYGAGPQDPESAGLYEPDGVHLTMGSTVDALGISGRDGFDLPRGAGSTEADIRKAVIADERNDENLALAQTHLAFIRFHNRVVDTLPASVPPALCFVRARELVTKHYQWMIRTDYLHRICASTVVDDVFTNGRRVFEPAAGIDAVPTMPIEFSIGTFRLGHSMVRSFYSWNRRHDDNTVALEQLFVHSAKGGNLGGRERLRSDMVADFRRLYDFAEAGRSAFAVSADKFNRALRIDTRLAARLTGLPSGIFGEPEVPPDDPQSNLAFRNLVRARMVKLATGQQMADLLDPGGVSLRRLDRKQILGGDNGANLHKLRPEQAEELAAHTPLWFYILREAELNGGKLNGVGARIVAETFHRAIEGSRASIVRDRSWRPTLGPDATRFSMVDLLLFAFEDDVRLLAPLEPASHPPA